jgi:hypothetical protein
VAAASASWRNGWQWQCGWQWIDGGGAVGKRRAGRFEWWWLENVKVDIDRVVIDCKKKKSIKKKDGIG